MTIETLLLLMTGFACGLVFPRFLIGLRQWLRRLAPIFALLLAAMFVLWLIAASSTCAVK
jgi:hypothetical protein